jgi:hypothetical protein
MWARGTVTWSVLTSSATCHDALGKAASQNWSSVLCRSVLTAWSVMEDEKLAEGPGDAGAAVARKGTTENAPQPLLYHCEWGLPRRAGSRRRLPDSPVWGKGGSRARENRGCLEMRC